MIDFPELFRQLDQHAVRFHGVRLDHALRLDLGNWTRPGTRPEVTLRTLVKQAVRFLFYPVAWVVEGEGPTVFFSPLSYPRDDYRSLIEGYRQQLDRPARADAEHRLTVNPWVWLTGASHLISLAVRLHGYRMRIRGLIDAPPFRAMMSQALRIVPYLLAAERSTALLGMRTGIVICDIHPAENLIVQYLKTKNLTTISLQHAAYPDFDPGDLSILTLCGPEADIHVMWGTASAAILGKHRPDLRVVIAGHPMMKPRMGPSSFDDTAAVVYFDNLLYADSNQRMLDVLDAFEDEHLGLTYRFHPLDRLDRYTFRHPERAVGDHPANPRYVIAHNTTAMLSAAFEGRTVIRFSDERNADYGLDFPRFTSAASLKQGLHHAQPIDVETLRAISDHNRTLADALTGVVS